MVSLTINVALSCDDYYAPFAAVCMASILEYTREEINFFVLSDKVSEVNKDYIRRVCTGNNSFGHVKFIDIDSGVEFASLTSTETISKAMYGRYLIPKLLPNVNKIIYTDVDVVFVGDIKTLWSEDISGFAIGAVPSQRDRLNNDYEAYKLTHGLDMNHKVFMSGLLLIDCEMWRKHDISNKLISISKEKQLLDQEAMNIYFNSNNYVALDPKYCVIYKILEDCYSIDEARKLKARQMIVHYPGAGDSKPWYNTDLPSAEFFWNCVERFESLADLKSKYGIKDEKSLVNYLRKYEQIIIYGAGNVGRMVLGRLTTRKHNFRNICFAVSDSLRNPPMVLNTDVFSIDELKSFSGTGVVIIAVDVRSASHIDKLLAEKGFNNVVVINDSLRKDLENNSSDIMNSLHGLWNEVAGLKKRMDSMQTVIDYAVDICSIPKARGNRRELQLADIKLLKIFHKVCEKHGLDYWLDYGTLLGAVRHGDFIPWDDDLDIGMPREDYDKVGDVLELELSKYGFVVNKGKGFSFQVIRLLYKDTAVQLDIWPYDYNVIGNYDEIDTLKKKVMLCNEVFYSRYNIVDMQLGKIKFPRKEFTDIHDDIIGRNSSKKEEVYFYTGAEALPYKRPFVYSGCMIYPLRKILFGDAVFYAPADSTGYLKVIYGDYNTFPRTDIYKHSNIIRNMNDSYNDIKKELGEILNRSF